MSLAVAFVSLSLLATALALPKIMGGTFAEPTTVAGGAGNAALRMFSARLSRLRPESGGRPDTRRWFAFMEWTSAIAIAVHTP
jgi:hypothetical protein